MNSKRETRRGLTLTDLLTRKDILEEAPTKVALIAHGIRLFHRNGVVGTGLGELLKVSKKSKSQFYSHFRDKDDFVCCVVEQQMTTMIRVARRYPLNCLDDFAAWFSPYIELAELPDNLGCPVAPLATEMSPSTESVRKESAKQFARWQDSIAQALSNLAQTEGFPETFDAQSTSRLLCCSIQGGFLFARVHQDTSFMHDVQEQYSHLLSQLSST